jgi:hypothetical protein
MKRLIYTGVLLFLLSCQARKKEPIIGTWEYERIELYDQKSDALSDSLLNKLHEMQKGFFLVFTKTEARFLQKKDGREEQMGNQPFSLEKANKGLRLKNTGRPDDIFPIISLSDSILKINMFESKEGYLVFRKKE